MDRALPGFAFALEVRVQADGLHELLADRGVGVQRGTRVLEDHGDLLAAHARHQCLRVLAPAALVLLHRHDAPILLRDARIFLQTVEQVARRAVRVQVDAAADHARPGGDEARGRERGDALAASALSHYAERFAALADLAHD